MLNLAAPFCHSHPCSSQKSRDLVPALGTVTGIKRKGVRQAKDKSRSLERQQPALQKQSSWQERVMGKKLVSVCWAEWQQPHHTLQKIRRGIVVHKENTPITAFDSPINSKKHSQQDIYSTFTPCVPSNGSHIMFQTEGNYLLKFLCTRRVKALIFRRCLGRIPYKCFDLKRRAHSCFTGLFSN